VLEVKDKKKRNNSPVKKIGTKEDEVHGKEVGRATKMLSASSEVSMVIMQRTITHTSVLVVARSNILLKIVHLKEKKR